MESCFSSEYLKTTIRPDGPLFADFETSVVLMAYEKPAPIQTTAAQQRIKNGNNATDAGNATVAMYFISTVDDTRTGTELEKTVTPLLTTALETHCQDDAWGMICNVGAVSDKFDLNSYFGGTSMPQYALVYKVFLNDAASVPAFRKAQKYFEDAARRPEAIDLYESFVVFSQEALVMDMGNGTRAS